MKTDLTDVTFTIPIRVESDDRANNIRTVVTYILHHFDTNIIILEDDKESKIPSILGLDLMSDITYRFNKNDEYLFHRTRFINETAMMASTPIIVNYDSDLILEKETYEECVKMIKEEGYEYLVGYSHDIFKVPQSSFKQILTDFTPSKCRCSSSMMKCTAGSPAWFLKDAFIKGGMENEKFISWGYEDNERNRRFITLGFKFGRATGRLWHLEHRRVSNSYNSNPHLTKNRKLYESISKETKEQCLERIKTFEWLNKYKG